METRRLCDHCGDFLTVNRDNQAYHDDCERLHVSRCQKAVKDFREKRPNVNRVLFMGIHVSYLYGVKLGKLTSAEKDEKRYKRETKTSELLKKTSALRNSKGGHLLIQVIGLSPEDSFTGAFDEFADTKLNALIEDGSMFTSVYKKTRMKTLAELEEYSEFLVLFVDASNLITTADFVTKIALDLNITNPNPYAMFNFIKKKTLVGETIPAELPSDLMKAQESRVLQMKGAAKVKFQKDKIVDDVWTKLKLRECISAFTKNETGGYYLLGVGEKVIKLEEYAYLTKVNDDHGLRADECEILEQGLLQKARESLLICDFDGKKRYQDVITITRRNTSLENHYILVVNVKPVNGVVFWDQDGPVAYKVERIQTNEEDYDDRVVKVTVSEWFHAILRDNDGGHEAIS